MAMMICRTCGDVYELTEEQSYRACPSCGTVNTQPRADAETLEKLQRATQQRQAGDYYHAETSYQHVLLECPDSHEALWGRLLCRYGVEYVQDPRTGRHMPVVHTVRRKPMQAEGDFAEACRNAPADVRAQYEADAEYIDRAMRRIIELSETCEPYDIFLCHKTTVLQGEGFTQDYSRAYELYNLLTQQGYRVFFAPKELESVAGENYEAGIYHALDTAQVMLVICSAPAHIMSAWVQNEWKRYLDMVDESEDKHLIPLLYGDLPASKLPREFTMRGLEGLKMGEMGSQERMMAVVDGYVPAPIPFRPASAARPMQNAQPRRSQRQKPKSTARPQPRRRVAAPVVSGPETHSPEAHFITEEVENGCRILRYVGNQARVSVPPTIGGQPVVEVAAVFGSNPGVAAVWLPEGLKAIGESTFRGCTRLSEVVIPAGVETIGKYAFAGCTSLTQVVLPEGVKTIGLQAFMECTALTDVLLPDSLQKIDASAFRGCTALQELIPPEGLKSIGMSAFKECTSLRTVALPAGLKSVRDYAFAGCTALKELYLPETALNMTISKMAFEGCCSLESAILPEGVTKVGAGAFRGCSGMKEVYLPDSLQALGADAFEGCASLTELFIPEGLAKVPGGLLKGCASLQRVDIPLSVTEIERDAFSGCTSLKELILPTELRTLEDCLAGCTALENIMIDDNNATFHTQDGVLMTWQGTLLCYPAGKPDVSYTLPEMVKKIAAGAFMDCAHLQTLEATGDVTVEKAAIVRCGKLKTPAFVKDMEAVIKTPEATKWADRFAWLFTAGLFAFPLLIWLIPDEVFPAVLAFLAFLVVLAFFIMWAVTKIRNRQRGGADRKVSVPVLPLCLGALFVIGGIILLPKMLNGNESILLGCVVVIGYILISGALTIFVPKLIARIRQKRDAGK